jgi:hypothetical protein
MNTYTYFKSILNLRHALIDIKIHRLLLVRFPLRAVLPTNFKVILPDQPKSSAAGEQNSVPHNIY